MVHPLKIVAARVTNWDSTWANKPELYVLLDREPPKRDQMVHRKYGDGMYVAEQDGYVSFFYHKGDPAKDSGGVLGGRVLVQDEAGRIEPVTFWGGWSSRAECVNALRCTSEPIVEMPWTADPESFARGHTFIAGGFVLSLAIEACKVAGLPPMPSAHSPHADANIFRWGLIDEEGTYSPTLLKGREMAGVILKRQVSWY